ENDLDRAIEWWRVDVDEELRREFEDEPEPKINPGPAHLAMYATHAETDVTVYHYPSSRLEPIPEDWEPPADSSRSSGRQERERVFGDHSDAVDSFIADLRRALSEPAE